jgi:hypothetical protein
VTADPARLERALAAIDAANAEDPSRTRIGTEEGPKELVHGRRVCQWIVLMDPRASDEQLIAGRAHHLRRWTRPRAEYPDGRAGYLQWRTAAKRIHAEAVAAIVVDAGYDPSVADDVGRIVRKEGLATDRRVQVHEDALCLVFLESQFEPLTDQLGDEHTVDVLRKTAAKMSPGGLALAGALAVSERGAALLREALEG